MSPSPAVLLLVALAAAGARGSRWARSVLDDTAVQATEPKAPKSLEAVPAPTPASSASRSGRSTPQARHRLNAALVLPLLAGQAARKVEAFPLLGPPDFHISWANPVITEASALPDGASRARHTALGVGVVSHTSGMRRLWPRPWVDLLMPPDLVIHGKHSEVYKCHVKPAYGAFEVAIKEFDVSPEVEASVRHEIGNAKALGGQSLIEVFAAVPMIESSGRMTKCFLMMEAADGDLRDQVLDMSGGVDIRDGVQIIVDILRGLRRIHREGYVHRNIKPENIFVMRDLFGDRAQLRAKIGDLGNARTAAELLASRPEPFGTREYIAPEVWTGGKETPKCDVWAAGIVLYELFVGRLPAFFLEERFRASPASMEVDPLRTAVPKEFNVLRDQGYLELRRREPQVAALIASMLIKNTWLRPSSEKALGLAKAIADKKGITIRPLTSATLSPQAEAALVTALRRR